MILTGVNHPPICPKIHNIQGPHLGHMGCPGPQLFRKAVQDDHGPLLRDLPEDTQRGRLDAGLARPALESWKRSVKATDEAMR